MSSSMTRMSRLAIAIATVALAGACSDDDDPVGPAPPGDYDPEIPASWAPAVTNPYLPLTVGTRWEYEAETDEGTESIIVEVLPQTRSIMGVTATIVRDQEFLDGELVEETFDWFAQDSAGNVWYLGEDSREFEDDSVVSTEGSWEWGVDGALPGIIMWADPSQHLNQEYRQEFAEGVAEDFGKVVAINESVTVPFGSFNGCVRTEDWNALEPGALEYKYYCTSIGLVLETDAPAEEDRVELIAVTPP